MFCGQEDRERVLCDWCEADCQAGGGWEVMDGGDEDMRGRGSTQLQLLQPVRMLMRK